MTRLHGFSPTLAGLGALGISLEIGGDHAFTQERKVEGDFDKEPNDPRWDMEIMMHEDFHFYTIYALARCSGLSPERSHVIAYASQHTDDAKYENPLEFANGGRFQQVLTAHKYLDLDALEKATCYQIWIPFHFLPGNLGIDFYERLLTRANSVIAQRMVTDFLNSDLRPYSLHRLGIILHVYADTWSHQRFAGVKHANMNDVKELRIKGETAKSFKALLGELKEKILEYAAPKLGHAQAGTIPDEPYREWQYKDFRNRKSSISNPERALDAAQNCYVVLLQFLRRFPHFSERSSLPWHQMVDEINRLFSIQGDLENRISAWRLAIAKGKLGFIPAQGDSGLKYQDREWFEQSVEVIQDSGELRFKRKKGFEHSNWKLFHDAAAIHRFAVLHEILPDYGIICG